MVKRSLFVLGALALLALAAPAAAEDDSTAWAYDAARELMSPFCPGVTLAECSSGQAADLRAWIIVQAAAGRTRADVYDELFERYGNKMRPTPKAEGIGLTAYALPIGAFLGGGVLVFLVLRRLTARSEAEAPALRPAASDDAELQRIVDEELAR